MSATAVTISPELRDDIIALSESGERAWRGIAIAARLILTKSDSPRMQVYQDVAALARQKAATIRAWVGMHKAVGDDLLAEFPQFGLAQWRLLVRAARQSGRELSAITVEWAATSDDYAGLPIPPDALAAKLDGGPQRDADPYRRALERAERALASAARHAPTENRRQAVQTVAQTVQRLTR